MKDKWEVKRKLKLQFTEAEAAKLQQELSQLRLAAKQRLPDGVQYSSVDDLINRLSRPERFE